MARKAKTIKKRKKTVRNISPNLFKNLVKANDVMMSELQANPNYLPSKYWKEINKKNINMLGMEGIENFKRTVSQNYYNWIITDTHHPMLRKVLFRWLHHPSLRIFRSKIEKDIKLRFITSDKPIILNWRERFIYRIFVGLVWGAMLGEDHERLNAKISEPEIGNPIHIWQNGKLITQDLANSIIECNIIASLVKKTGGHPKIAEIGAGSGRLAHVYSKTQKGKYFIFDIPPALNVSEWYLSQVLLDKTIFHFRKFDDFESIRGELEKSDVAFFSANQIEKFPSGYFDVIVSISTLPEMKIKQAKLYIDIFQRLSAGYIYLKQWKLWKNPLDGTLLGIDDYINNKDWSLILDREDCINPDFFNRVWQRT
jgi:putative sugar O-methyltransferase